MSYKLVLVCGSRTFNNKEYMRQKLNEIRRKEGNLLIREGGAIGADHQARLLCTEELWLRHDKTFKPKYSRYGRLAPLKRNIQMLDTKPKPELVIGFHDRISDGGTAHTIRNAKQRGIKIYEFFGEKADIKFKSMFS